MAKDINEEAVLKIVKKMKEASENSINNASLDRTYIGTIMEVLFNKDTLPTGANYKKYKVRYNNIEEDIIIDDGNAHSLNEKVYITAPCNNLGKKIIDFNKIRSYN